MFAIEWFVPRLIGVYARERIKNSLPENVAATARMTQL